MSDLILFAITYGAAIALGVHIGRHREKRDCGKRLRHQMLAHQQEMKELDLNQ